MNRVFTIILGFIFLISVTSSFAQKSKITIFPPLAEDTAINPHDFTNEYYLMNGINPKGIINRRTGTDGLSVFSNSSNPFHTNVRILATIPAYDQHGDMIFWYPLGELQDYGFTEDKAGIQAREMAMKFPIYVFPNSKIVYYRTFADMRQAAMMDNSWSMTSGQDVNPLGIRAIFVVNFTEKAFSDEAIEMMQYLMKKNGSSADDTPIIKTKEDFEMLMKEGMIEANASKIFGGEFAISTPIYDPTRGAVARDAFLWMAMKDDKPLPTEDMFVWQFHCLQKLGTWCQ